MGRWFDKPSDDDLTAAVADVVGWDAVAATPWAEGQEMPDVHLYVESELFVAGAISTLPPYTSYHPAWALPVARQALIALGEWEPTG